MINENILSAAQEQADAIQRSLNNTIGSAHDKMHDMRQARQDELAGILSIVSKCTGENLTEPVVIAAIEAAYMPQAAIALPAPSGSY